jgi:hypothetical protein
MGRDAIRGKKKPFKQPTLPGLSNASVKGMRVSPPVSETLAERKKPENKKTLKQELVEGNRPMFMTASEIIKHANLHDAGMRNNTWLGDEKPESQVNKEKYVMAKKLKESKTGTFKNSHTRREYQSGSATYEGKGVPKSELPSLHEHLSEKGFQGSFPLLESTAALTKLGRNERPITLRGLNVFEGHHRLAAMRNINPKQFMAINWVND